MELNYFKKNLYFCKKLKANMFTNFSDLPNFPNLFLDYLYEFDRVKDFYHLNFRNSEQFLGKFNEIKDSKRISREDLSRIIKNQYQDINCSKRTLSNINLLSSDKTMAVVTGQQLTIFGGPLYTFYKIITAIKLCTKLKEAYVDFNFVPVFWMEGDDHDFEEVNSINIYNKENILITINYLNTDEESLESGSVGNLVFDNKIESALEHLKQNLRDSDFKDELIGLLEKYYFSGNTFKSSFKGLLMHFFDEFGLIIFDPQDIEYKKLLIPIFENELQDYELHTKIILKRSAQLEENYHAQVKVKPINLFYSENNKRFLIEPDENGYRLKNKRKKFSKEEILNLLNTNPEFFSPNVLLRPICQDYLFPTAFYIGGPGEISYFAQLIPYYAIFKIPQPIIYPRSSVTLLEKNIKNLIDKYGLSFLSIIQQGEDLLPKILSNNSDINTEDIFHKINLQLNDIFSNLENQLIQIDKNLLESIKRTQEKTMSNFDLLKGKITNSQLQKNEILFRQLKKIINSILPDSVLQERLINFTYYYNKYGNEIISLLFDKISISKFEHQIIEIDIK